MEIPANVTILASIAALIAQTLRTQGYDPAPLFANAGIDMKDSSDPNSRIPMIKMQALWREAVRVTGNPDIGLVVAQHFQPAMLQGLGFAWLASDSLHDGLSRLVKYSHLINVLPDFRLEDNHDTVNLVIRLPELDQEFVHTAMDGCLAIFLRMCQITAGTTVMPVRTSLQRPEPVDKTAFEAIFGPSIRYGAPAYCLCFDATLVNTRLPTTHHELARLNDQTVIDYLARFERNNIAMQVRSRIIEELPGGETGLENIALSLNTSLRNLQRKLKEENTSYSELLNKTRRELAMQYIQDSSRTIGEITYLLGFSEPSNFARAFKRWTGESPRKFRTHSLP